MLTSNDHCKSNSFASAPRPDGGGRAVPVRSQYAFNSTSASSNASFGWSVHSQHEQDLPMYSVTEEKARRRVPHASSGSDAYPAYVEGPDVYDDEGKDVYAKMRTSKMPTGSGRPRRPPPPPCNRSGPPTY